jgi:methylmalonyl-CoA mutase cobalamin-binding domain/chain
MTELAVALRDLEEDRVLELVEEKLAAGISPLEIIADCNEGMSGVGELFSQNEYYLSQLIFSAEILKAVMARIEPLLEKKDESKSPGLVIIGTVAGDIHDIGKNITLSLLKGAGFDVIDLGVDVPAEKFVETVKETNAKVLGLSALLNFTYPEMKNVVDAIEAAGLRDSVNIIIGGAPCNEQVREFTGADYYAPDAMAGVNLVKEIYAEAK